MRIRQIKPAFWTDSTLAAVSYPARLFYIGLWNVADDSGWIEWSPPAIGATLFPYETPRRREKLMATWTASLVEVGRLTVLECGCACVPTMPRHQRITGKQSFFARERHERQHVKRSPLTDKQSLLSDSPGSGSGSGSGTERKDNAQGAGVFDFTAFKNRETA